MQKPTKPRDWLTPKVYKGQSERESVLLCLYTALNKKIAQKEQAKVHADNKGRSGKYRYYEGVIAGLIIVRTIISQSLADEHELSSALCQLPTNTHL